MIPIGQLAGLIITPKGFGITIDKRNGRLIAAAHMADSLIGPGDVRLCLLEHPS